MVRVVGGGAAAGGWRFRSESIGRALSNQQLAGVRHLRAIQ
jgi:hypothetical protein